MSLSSLPSQYRSLFTTLIQYSRQKDLQKGKALHAQIIKTGPSSCVYIANSLVNLYAKCGDLPKAKLVFEAIPDKDVVSWNSLINGYSQQGQNGSSLVMELFQRMRAENAFPNAHTFAGVFTAASYASRTSLGAGKLISLLNMYCKAGLVLDARKVFDRMLERNSVSWATMISGYAVQRLAGDALALFGLMRHRNEVKEEVNEFVLTGVLSALALPEFVGTGKQIHCLAVKNGLISFVSVENALVSMYAKCGSLDDALRTFKMSGDKNSITWSAMITGFAQSGDSQKALDLFSHMHFSGVMPSEFTFVGVINACSDIGALEEGKQVHSYSLKLGFEFQIYIMTALVDMYAKCGNVSDARKGFDYLREPDIVLWTSMIGGYVQNGENEAALTLYCIMQSEGMMPNELTMASVLKACSSLSAFEQGRQIHARTINACRNYHNYELGAYVGEKLMELGSQESSAYVLLSSIYTALGRSKDVERVRSLMKFRGVSKEPGCSWIELKSQVHVFVVGDEMHPQIENIRHEIRRLIKHMKDKDYQPSSTIF
ncbi:pentatricopeptide repeat-containing protein [Prunus yedoensis var. nudiflora]|uniref:Pentatricopeptide repeat-containing protein n=1 Tax=Prunus yedoensis var. nudiflora TaxID=2094558 RepID=A0A314U935_PRUYE|nr:pentatricopeptide repeat-containing protein [Prunus yedoensis var. nudiflora]